MKRPEYQKMALKAWGDAPPAWVRNLAAACELNGIPATAERIGLSADRIRRIIRCRDWDNGCGHAYCDAVEKNIMGGRP